MLLFPYPAIIYHSTIQKYPAFFVLNRWISQWFGVYLTLSSHFAHAFYEIQCIVRVISAARFENTWPSHSANFEKEIETRLNILLSKTGKIIMIELSLSSIFRIGNFTKSNQRSSLHSHFILPRNITTIKS